MPTRKEGLRTESMKNLDTKKDMSKKLTLERYTAIPLIGAILLLASHLILIPSARRLRVVEESLERSEIIWI